MQGCSCTLQANRGLDFEKLHTVFTYCLSTFCNNYVTQRACMDTLKLTEEKKIAKWIDVHGLFKFVAPTRRNPYTSGCAESGYVTTSFTLIQNTMSS